MKKAILIFLLAACQLSAFAQRAALGKLSSWVRSIVAEQRLSASVQKSNGKSFAKNKVDANSISPSPMLTAFVRAEGNVDSLFSANGCQQLLSCGDIYIVAMPISNIAALSQNSQVSRIESQRGTHALMDISGAYLGATKAYQGLSLPQAYTGMGVMVGVMDIGFDLTHPNFYDRSATNYRIRSFWDQLSADTLNSAHYVGQSYHGKEALLRYAHSRDGLDQTHGTHTLGSLAGSGFDSPYRGIAYESDICIVSNATVDDVAFIDTADYYKFTYATDALGFKYIFDTADSLGMPCVVSFSEGAPQDFRGDDQLYFAMLDSLTGPGHILVSSAGNNGLIPSYIHKPLGDESRGSFVWTSANRASLTINSLGASALRTVFYHDTDVNDTIIIKTSEVLAAEDSMLIDSTIIAGQKLHLAISAYDNCYDASRQVYDVQFLSLGRLDALGKISVEIIGKDADAELYCDEGYLVANDLNPALQDAECTHNINSPSAAPSVICVGANSYRQNFENYLGDLRTYDMGTNGQRGEYSSVGPTFDGRIKPDVMAPGTNVISSYSSYYLENHPQASDILSDVAHFDFQGRTYAWNANSGTSMASPIAAGVIALWLQACPTLTPQDVMRIISHTSRRVDHTLSYPNNLYGYGEINAYAGLLYILGIDGITDISHSTPHDVAISPLSGGRLKLAFAFQPSLSLTATVYSLSGNIIDSQSFMPTADSHVLQLPASASGVVVVQISGENQYQGSQLIRISK